MCGLELGPELVGVGVGVGVRKRRWMLSCRLWLEEEEGRRCCGANNVMETVTKQIKHTRTYAKHELQVPKTKPRPSKTDRLTHTEEEKVGCRS